MRRLLLILLALMLVFGLASCKAKLDKAKIAGLAYDFVMAQVVSLLDSGEFDTDRIPDLAVAFSIQFVDTYSDEVPARYRDEVKGFLCSIIPKLISDYMPGLGEDEGAKEEAVEMLLEEWNAYGPATAGHGEGAPLAPSTEGISRAPGAGEAVEKQ